MTTVHRSVYAALVLLSLGGTALPIGCASEGAENAESDSSDILESLGSARACLVRDTFLRAEVGDFEILQSFPFPVTIPPRARPLYAVLPAPGFDKIYYVEYAFGVDGGPALTFGEFYDRNGVPLLRSSLNHAEIAFFYPTGEALRCRSSGDYAEGGVSSSSGGIGSVIDGGCRGVSCSAEAGIP